MNYQQIRAVSDTAFYDYTYEKDPAGTDTWRSHANAVLANEPWSGDCDDAVSTMLDLCARQGQSLNRMWRLDVFTSDNEGHQIGVVEDDDGEFWIVGDTLMPRGAVYRASQFNYTPGKYQKMSEVAPNNLWHDGLPWENAP